MESLAHKLSTIALTLLLAISIIQHAQHGSGEVVMQLRSDEGSDPRAAVASERVLMMSSGGTGGDRGLGSYSAPPSCKFKCSGCTPCMTVPVAVRSPGYMPCGRHPSQSTMEDIPYLPEVWCCQCGGKLYPPSP